MGPLGNLKVGGREVETKKDLLCTHKKGTREKRKDESFLKRILSPCFSQKVIQFSFCKRRRDREYLSQRLVITPHSNNSSSRQYSTLNNSGIPGNITYKTVYAYVHSPPQKTIFPGGAPF